MGYGSASGPAEDADPTKGHDILREGLGKMKKKVSKTKTGETKASEGKTAESKTETKQEEKLPAGVHEADKSKLTADEKKTLEATNAGLDAEVDSGAHFKTTDTNILGNEETDEIKGEGGKYSSS